ncbi:MAG: hypothetical protein ABI759_20145 [Candidatus Solibacter sp.]
MKKLLLTTTVLIGTALTGCAGSGYYATARFGPPPAPRYGMVGRAPGVGFVWTDGHWDRRNNNWAWVDGRWMRPLRGRAVWVPGSWHQRGQNWRFERGHWR